MNARVVNIFVAPKGGADMGSASSVEAIAGHGLNEDRYCTQTGHWNDGDECQVTLIEKEALDQIAADGGVEISNGEHRRNIVTSGIRLEELAGKKFRVGGALLEFDRPRPPCGYIAALTSRKMTKALWGRSGICARVLESGPIQIDDHIVVLTAE